VRNNLATISRRREQYLSFEERDNGRGALTSLEHSSDQLAAESNSNSMEDSDPSLTVV